MKNTRPRIAAIQMCSSHCVQDNLAVAAHAIAQAATVGANLVVLPEMFAIMGRNSREKLLAKETFGHGKIQDFLADQAQKHGLWIVGGTIPLATDEEHKIRAASLMFDDKGSLVARYDKIHMFDVTLSNEESYKESDVTQPGDTLVVVDTPVGRVGMGVCFDIRFPEMFRALSDKKMQIIALPTAFTVTTGKAHWELLARTRALENTCYLVGACQGGEHSGGRKTYGHSLIIDPWGRVIATQQDTAYGVITAEILLEKTGNLFAANADSEEH